MKQVLSIGWCLMVLFLLGIPKTDILAIDAREPLTIRNIGVYGGFSYGMSNDSPFDFLIVAVLVLVEGLPANLGRSWSEQGPEWNRLLHEARHNGKRVIAVVGGYLCTEDGAMVKLPTRRDAFGPLHMADERRVYISAASFRKNQWYH